MITIANVDDSFHCWNFKDDKNSWHELGQMKSGFPYLFQACAVGNEIFLTGGLQRISSKKLSEGTKGCWSFNIPESKWSSLPSMIDARSRHTMTCIDGEVYVFGGWLETSLASGEKLTTARQKWVQLKPMHEPLHYLLSVGIGSNIYVMAGQSSVKTQMYNTKADTWTPKANMPTTCKYGCATVVSNEIYVFSASSRCSLHYNPQTDAWSVLACPQSTMLFPAACQWNGKILLGGGRVTFDTTKHSDKVEVYDPSCDKWSPWCSSLPRGLSFHFMFSVPLSSVLETNKHD